MGYEGPTGPLSTSGEEYTMLEELMACIPVSHVGIFIGTANCGHQHRLLQTSVNHTVIAPLAGLSREAAKTVSLAGAAVNDNLQRFFNVVFALSSGVPRMVRYAAGVHGSDPNGNLPVWITSWEAGARNLYSSAQIILQTFSADEIACVILNCGAGASQPVLSATQTVPGTTKMWQDFQRCALVFPVVICPKSLEQQWSFPRLLWDERHASGKVLAGSATEKIIAAAKAVGVNLGDLLPSRFEMFADGVSDAHKG
jgi:hypothetical protein